MPRVSEFDRIRRVLAEADVEEPLTASEIRRALAEHGVEFDSAHQVATVLGRRARRGDVEVIEDQPYRYRIHDDGEDGRNGHDGRRENVADGRHDGPDRRRDPADRQPDGPSNAVR